MNIEQLREFLKRESTELAEMSERWEKFNKQVEDDSPQYETSRSEKIFFRVLFTGVIILVPLLIVAKALE